MQKLIKIMAKGQKYCCSSRNCVEFRLSDDIFSSV